MTIQKLFGQIISKGSLVAHFIFSKAIQVISIALLLANYHSIFTIEEVWKIL